MRGAAHEMPRPAFLSTFIQKNIMCIESPIYQKAFVRYLRYGHTPDAQMKSSQDANNELLDEKRQGSSILASQLVDDRISKLELAFAEAGRDWPNIPAPDTEALENDFKAVYREMLGNFSEASGAMLPEDFSRRFTRSENFLVSRYGQKLDATIQPHYGVEYFSLNGQPMFLRIGNSCLRRKVREQNILILKIVVTMCGFKRESLIVHILRKEKITQGGKKMANGWIRMENHL